MFRSALFRKAALTLLGSLMSLCMLSPEASADVWFFGKGSGKRKSDLTYGFSLGSRFLSHYNRLRVVSTPPESLFAEVQAYMWYKRLFGIYASYGYSIALSESSAYSFGMKIPFLAFTGDGGFVSGLTFFVTADAAKMMYGAPTHPYSYPTEAWVFRYGGTMMVSMGRSGFYLDGSLMATNINGNFFIAPFAGIGFQF